ncbi:MAG: hypothetical protein U5J97_02855 [Trueperaceae bacterium]|nr:hypothetical protein [Trueperaceae bacterium]
MMYQFMAPFEVDSGRIERELGLTATTLQEGLARTVSVVPGAPDGRRSRSTA